MKLIDITNDNILLNYKCYACPHEETYPSTSPGNLVPICPKCFNEMRYVGVKVRIDSPDTPKTTHEWIKVGQRVNFSGKYIGYIWSGPAEIESIDFSSEYPVLLKCLDDIVTNKLLTKLSLTLEETSRYCTPMVNIANPSWVKPGTWCKFTNTPVGALIRRIESIESHGSLIKFTDGSSCTADNIHTGRVVEAKLAPWQADTMLAYLLSKKKFFHDGEWMLGCSLSTNTDGGYTLYLKERGAQGTIHSIYKKYVLRDLETDDHGPCGSLTN